MLKLNEDSIRLNCCSDEIYKRGLSYYMTGRVINIKVEEDCIKGQVIGTYDYNVVADFFPDGQLKYSSCECRAYDTYPGFCKHLVAFLLYLKNESDIVEKMMDGKISSKILDFFNDKAVSTARTAVSIEVMLDILNSGKYGRKIQPAVSIKIGDKKLYQIKNIKRFIEQLDSKNTIVFGKGFTYDPAFYCFSDTDQPVIDFIREMYEIDKISSENSDYMHFSGTIFKDKYIYLSSQSLDRLFGILGDRKFGFTLRGTKYEGIKIAQTELPVDFKLQKSGNDLLLDVDLPENMTVLTPDGKYIFHDECIYSIPKSQRENLLPFYNAVIQTGDRTIRFLEGDRDKFASVVIPHIKGAGRLSIDENVSSMFYLQPLMPKLYLDKEGQKVTVEVSFQYGDISIDPLRIKQTTEVRNDSIIMRDLEEERNVFHLIEQSGFRINKEHVYLDDDEKIYTFVTKYLPELQKSCEVFYSEAFKNMRIYDSSSLKSSVKLDSELDLLEFEFSIDEVDKSELAGIFASLKRKKKYYRLKNGSFLPLTGSELENMSKLMEYMDIDDKDIDKGIVKLPKYKSLYMDEQLRSLDSIYVERNASFKELVKGIRESKDMDFDLPDGIEGTLRGYQISGYKWLKSLAQYGFGGILADDMGLGKTLQTIVFLLSEKGKFNVPSLVVCPTSLVYNWESEIQRFAPSLKILVISGSRQERSISFNEIQENDVVITSYPLIRRDIDNYRDISFAYCIIDEAQHIKNPNSLSAKAVKDIRAKGYFALTGTPLENNLTELWSIFDFIMPGYLMRHDRFSEKFERPIISDHDMEALKELKKYVKPFILRRLKKDVLKELPPKIESLLTSELTENQKTVYLAYLQQIRGFIEDEVREKGFEKSRIEILAGLTRLRQVCCHPSLFIDNYNGGSGKMDMLMEIVQEILEGGHRALIFSQFTGALKLIRLGLENENISYFYLDGSIEAAERSRMVKLFNEGEKDIFLISLKAGGTGLNLTGADTVIHFDPWWNPAVEEQATDRAYRIGQENAVQVMKLITKGTIEEKIYKLQQKKKELIGSILQPGETFITKMSQQDIMELFKL